MLELLENIDRKILLLINSLHTDWLDQIMWAISSKWFWLPIIILIIALIIWKYRKKFWLPIIALILCFATTDIVSHKVKETICRCRPTHNVEIKEQIHVVNNYRGGQHGFFSGHAANSFGIALLSLLIIRKKFFSLIAIIWATIVSYSRMYLGVHYPADIFVGSTFGLTTATCIFYITKTITKKSKFL